MRKLMMRGGMAIAKLLGPRGVAMMATKRGRQKLLVMAIVALILVVTLAIVIIRVVL